MALLNKKNKKENISEFGGIDFYKINNELSDYINEASFMQDYSVDIYRDFVDVEKKIKNVDSETRNNIKNIKNFLEKNSKNNFYLRMFLGDVLSMFNELSIDGTSLLRNRRFFYYSLKKHLSQKKETKKTNKGLILKTEVFRYGGDEFAAIISRDIGTEVVFFDLMYLNYFNFLMGYKGGDAAIYASSRIIEDTLRSFENKATKTRNIIDEVLEKFSTFKFDKENNKLNKIILHIDIGYSNDLEILEVEKEFINKIKTKKLKIEKDLSFEDRASILLSLAEIRASIQKKNSKLYLLLGLYKVLKDGKKNVEEILNGYLSFTKNTFLIKEIVEKIYNNSKNEDDLISNMAKQSIELEREKSIDNLNLKNIDKKSVLSSVIFDKASNNIPAIMSKISIEEVMKRWGY